MPLPWTIGLVSACPIHHCELETVCPHRNLGETPTGRSAKRFAMSAPGVCGSCGSRSGAYEDLLRCACIARGLGASEPASDLHRPASRGA